MRVWFLLLLALTGCGVTAPSAEDAAGALDAASADLASASDLAKDVTADGYVDVATDVTHDVATDVATDVPTDVALPSGCTSDAACSDGLWCTTDTCVFGACAHALDPVCDDGNACTADSCKGPTCLHPPASGACSDGDVCDGIDTCVNGSCVSGTGPPCDDGIACTFDSCTGAGCVSIANDATCADNNTCTLDACTSIGCTHTLSNGICDDGNVCTYDVCENSKCLHGNVKFECPDSDPCTDDTCVGAACVHTFNTAPCTAKLLCVGSGVCQLGVCGGGGNCGDGTCDCGEYDTTCPADCPSEALIPAGGFLMGCVPGDPDCLPNESPQHKVTLSPFYIDVYEVTVGKMQQCMAAGVCNPVTGVSCNAGVTTKVTHPVNCISWSDAAAYCKWAGKRLPSEAEWERAARGGVDGSIYPWGNTLDCNHALWNESMIGGCGFVGDQPVASKPLGKNGFGLYDMSGSVSEWTADWYDAATYATPTSSDPQGPPSGQYKVARGGSFASSDPAQLRTSLRVFGSLSSGGYWMGFRCARTP